VVEPFERRSPRSGRLAKLVGAGSMCMREFEDALAAADRVRDVSLEQVEALGARHGVDLGRRFRTARRNLYRRYFEYCLLDQQLSEDETADLAHLRSILGLDASDVNEIHEQVATALYGKAIDRVLEDHRVEPEEQAFLERLRHELHLSDEEARRLEAEGQRRARQRYLSRTVSANHLLVASDQILELTGRSASALEDAIRAALDEATRAVPELVWFEVVDVRGRVADGRVVHWEVALRAGFGERSG
jgi:dodecin